MKRKKTLMCVGIGLIIVIRVITSQYVPQVAAQSGGGYTLTWSSVDGGGGKSVGGNYALTGAIGQPDAGAMNAGNYTLIGGFWSGVGELLKLYLPLIRR